MLIAETGGTPVGYWVVDARDRAGNWRIMGDRYADLESIAVLPMARGHGVGTALMHEVYRGLRARGIDELTTQVVMGNHEARRFYERMGFRPLDDQLSWARCRLTVPERLRRTIGFILEP